MGEQKGTMLLMIFLSTVVLAAEATKGSAWVECTGEEMVVRVASAGIDNVELEKWGELPGCAPTLQGNQFILSLPLDDNLSCGTTRVKNKITGETVYYHRVSVTSNKNKEVMLVKCRVAPDNATIDNIVKRDVLPPEFEEPDYIEITSEVSGTAPIPILGVGVRQDGNLVGGQINVRPGTPLTMEVYLDNVSAGTYGILMSYMEVTDTHDKRETIIFNGCSVDPVLFDNFITTDGDLVSAKFRAFKFPETNYVLFRGTVDVCLDKCQGIACSNGQLGFGRRRRATDNQATDPNKIFEVTMMTFLKVDEKLNNTGESGLSAVADDAANVASMTEEIAEDVAKSVAKSMVAVERAIKETDDFLSWESAAEYGPERPRTDSEPTFIYFNGGHTLTCSIYMTLAALLLVVFH